MKRLKKIVLGMLVALLLSAIPMDLPVTLGATNVEAAVKISKKSVVLIKGQKVTLKVKGTSKKAKWTSSKKSIATVSSKGVVTAKKKGTTTIKAKIGSKKYTCKVTVQTPALSQKALSLTVGGKATIKLNGTNQKVTWQSSNTSIATVSGGTITAKNAGSASITAKVLGKKYTCNVTVKKASPATPVLGTRENPISGYAEYTTDVYDYKTYLGKFKIQLLDYKDGATAKSYVMQNEYNTPPSNGQEYIYAKYRITYLSGSRQVNAIDVVNYFSGFYNSKANLKIDNLDWGFNFDNVDDMFDVSLYPGGSSVCSTAILIRSGNTPITYRIQTGFDSKNYEETYTWFKTQR